MGKIITIPPNAQFQLGKGENVRDFDMSFLEFISDALDTCGPVETFGQIKAAKKLDQKLISAGFNRLQELSIEDAELKILQAAVQAYMKTRNPKAAREFLAFGEALDYAKDVELDVKATCKIPKKKEQEKEQG